MITFERFRSFGGSNRTSRKKLAESARMTLSSSMPFDDARNVNVSISAIKLGELEEMLKNEHHTLQVTGIDDLQRLHDFIGGVLAEAQLKLAGATIKLTDDERQQLKDGKLVATVQSVRARFPHLTLASTIAFVRKEREVIDNQR